MSKVKLSQKLRYRFDNTMSRGPGALILWLAILTGVMIVITTVVVLIFSIFPDGEDSSMGVGETLWQTLMRAMDAGTVAGDSGWGFRLIMFIVTLGGIFILSTLIGILSSGIDEKLEELRKGRSFVVEKNHQLILGWNSKVFTIIDELAAANENQKKPRIVVMAREDKTMMEDAIREKCENLRNTKVICRSGDPNDINDLNIVNLNETKSIVVLSSETAPDADAQTIKVLLAIINHPERGTQPFHVVAQMRQQKNILAGKIVGKDEVELMLTDDLVSRIMVQTCRQSGLSVVYTEITGFDGDEIYIIEESQMIGKTFGEIIFKYNDSSVIGLEYPDGTIKLNPPMDAVLEKGGKLVALTEDDDTLIINAPAATINEDAIVFVEEEKPSIERTLVLSWNNKGPAIVREMSAYVPAGSELLIVSGHENVEQEYKKMEISNNMKIDVRVADTTDREVLESLNVHEFTQIIVLSNTRRLNVQEADSQTLMTLLHLRDLIDIAGTQVRIVSEIMDVRNRELASVTKADDFVVSDKLISQLVSQVSETKELVNVFNDMFDADGSEVYLKPISNYVKTGVEMDFFTVLESAKRQGQTAVGYRIMSKQYDKNSSYGIVLNPVKTNKVTFSPGDKIIVFAED
ncbi:MAG: NAD-binding protein [Crocinitomicaceae bacterium]|nr:NAD-binding protein [Crocinitomicaceae bacterium]